MIIIISSMNFHAFLFVIFFKESQGKWNLVFNDEFENKTLDLEKWEPENEEVSCHGNYMEQLNCNTNSTENLRLIDGTLAITAFYGKHLDKDYTSGRITTKQNFTYGRFEIRAALPKGKMLISAIYMIPVNTGYSNNGKIQIMSDYQTRKLGSYIHYSKPTINEGIYNGDFTANSSLNDFHTYAIEWNQFEIKWFFDDINHLNININRSLGQIYTKNGEPFHSPFKLLIYLGVGGSSFPDQILTVEDMMDWKCSLLIIDYVRIYEWINETGKLDSKDDRVSTDEICSHVMPLMTPKKKSDISFSTVILVVSSLLLLISITIIVFLFIRQKNLKRMNFENNSENYDDICSDDGYDNIDVYNEYSVPYELDYYVESDVKVRSLEMSDKNEYRNSDPSYLPMDKKVLF